MSTEGTAEAPHAPRGSGTVLVVDDNEANRYAVASWLRDAGFGVVEAETGHEALQLAESRPDLVMLDVRLPDASGFDVARTLKASPTTATIPVLYLSSSLTSNEWRAHGLETGADAYLTHPIEPRELVATVRSILRIREAQRAAERAASRTGVLQEVTAALSSALTPEDVIAAVVSHVVAALGAGGASVALVTPAGDALEVVHAMGYPEEILGRWKQMPLDMPLPNTAAVRTGELTFLASQAEWDQRYPLVGPSHRATGFEAAAAVPLTTGGRTLGVMTLSFRDARTLGADDRALLVALARQCAQALERARAYTVVERARAEAEQSAARTTLLQDITASLARATTAQQVSDTVVARAFRALDALVGLIVVRTPDGAHLDILGAANVSADLVEPWRHYPLDANAPTAEAVRTGRPVGIGTLAELRARYPERLDAFARLGANSLYATPILLEGRALGAMLFMWAEPRTVSADDAALISAVADQAAQALERVRLLEAERTARAEAERAQAAADAANRAKSDFLATMSHEIRTPINAITGYAQLLELGIAGGITDQQRDYLARLAGSAQHLLGLVNDVLDLAKVDAGEMIVGREELMTGAAVIAALDLTRPLATARGVTLIDRRPGDPGVPYVGDEHRVRQVLVNLLSNAAKFTEQGGTVTVTCDTAAEGPPTARGRGPWAFIRVTDTGIGIAPEQLSRVFEPFIQAESGRTRTKGGTGLGLAISRRLARLMDGELTVESTPGVGSTFTLWLPSAESSLVAENGRSRERSGEPALRTGGLADLGELLRTEVDAILQRQTALLRADPATPHARQMPQAQLEDHQWSYLADITQSLVIVGGGREEAVALLRDGSAIQRTIAEHHGVRRHSQGWSEAALRREHEILRHEVEQTVRSRLGVNSDTAVEALDVLLGFLDRGRDLSLRAWRRAAEAQDRRPPAAPDPGADTLD